jgi:transposase
MRVRTVLNRLVDFKGFVLVKEHFVEREEGLTLEVVVRPRANSRALCSCCGAPAPLYDRLEERRFRFPALWCIPVFLAYCMRRVDCARCGVKVEAVPWAQGKSPVTKMLALQLSDWARLLSWQEVCERFHVNWRQVYESVKQVVDWGLEHRDLDGVEAIGIDEVQFGKGQQYLTVVYQLCGETRRLLYVGQRRDAEALRAFFDAMGVLWCGAIKYVCTDMWRAYLKVVRENMPDATHVLDRFHIVKLLNDAVDKVRREENRELRTQGVEVLKGLKYVFLKRPENLTEHQQAQLQKVMNKKQLKTVRAWLWKEKFQLFWEYTSPYWARRYLRRWERGAMRSRLAPMKKFVKTLRSHEELIMNWFTAKKVYSSGAVEGMNRKINLVTRKSYGFRSFEVLKIALFHTLGHLPEPEVTHRF